MRNENRNTEDAERKSGEAGFREAVGSRPPVMRKNAGYTFEVEDSEGNAIWASAGLGDGTRAPEMLSGGKRARPARFHRREETCLIYRIPSENAEASNEAKRNFES